jgi:hypothetical protein
MAQSHASTWPHDGQAHLHWSMMFWHQGQASKRFSSAVN